MKKKSTAGSRLQGHDVSQVESGRRISHQNNTQSTESQINEHHPIHQPHIPTCTSFLDTNSFKGTHEVYRGSRFGALGWLLSRAVPPVSCTTRLRFSFSLTRADLRCRTQLISSSPHSHLVGYHLLRFFGHFVGPVSQQLQGERSCSKGCVFCCEEVSRSAGGECLVSGILGVLVLDLTQLCRFFTAFLARCKVTLLLLLLLSLCEKGEARWGGEKEFANRSCRFLEIPWCGIFFP